MQFIFTLTQLLSKYPTYILRIFFLVFISLSSISQIYAQSTKELDKKWELAKGHYSDENYDIALMLFQSLTSESNPTCYIEYANYYTSLCYFKLGKLKKSREYLLQLNNKFPNWKDSSNAKYLLANIEFINQNYERSLELLKNNNSTKAKSLKLHYLSKIESIYLISLLHQNFPRDKEVATILAYKSANKKPLLNNDKEYIYSLISEYKINDNKLKNHLESATENHFKDTFNVALFYPFKLTELEKYKPNRRNQFVIDHYWGIQLALDTLNKQDINLKLTTYDTENDTSIVKTILTKDEVKQIDLIVGAVYKKNMELVSTYCSDNQIVCFNPFSSKGQTISDSGFVYMYNPSYESIGRNAAQLVLDSFPDKEIVVLSFATKKDTTIANTFIKTLADSGKIVKHKLFVERGTDVLYPLSRVRSAEAELVFAPSQNTSIASALTSWLIMRELEIPVIGNVSWFDSQEFNIVNFNKREAYFYDENYINTTIDSLYNFKEKYFNTYNIPPSEYAYKGFELGMLLGNNLSKYGKYFNQALWNMETQDGIFYPQFNYKNSYCNNFVPILKLNDYQLVPANFNVQKIKDESTNGKSDE